MTPKLRRKPRITLTPTFHYSKITNLQLIAVCGEDRKEFVKFRYFHVATNFEPA